MSASVLQVSTADRGGGAEGVALTLHRALRAAGREATLAVGRKLTDEPGVELLRQGRTRAWELRDRYESQRNVRRAMLAHALAEPGLLVDLARGHEDFRYPGARRLLEMYPGVDVLHFHNLHGRYFDPRALPTLTRDRPTLITLHDEWTYTGHCAGTLECMRWQTGCGACPHLDVTPRLLRDGTARNWAEKRSIWEEARIAVAAPSRWLLERAESSILASAITAAHLIPNGVDIDHFSPGDRGHARARLGIEADRLVLAFVAQKAHDNPLKDFATLRAALDVLGRSPGPPVVALALGAVGHEQTAGRVTIRFTGQVPHAEVRDYLRSVDLYVHAARWENHPLAVLEALACGCPVVATDVGGVREQVRSRGVDPEPTGVLVGVGNARGLAATIESLLEDTDTLRAMGAAARRDAETRFDVDTQVAAYVKLYERIGNLGSRRRPDLSSLP